MFLLIPAHPGCPRQNPESNKTVVCVCVCLIDHEDYMEILYENSVIVLASAGTFHLYKSASSPITGIKPGESEKSTCFIWFAVRNV